MFWVAALDGFRVSTKPVAQESRDATDRGDADACQIVDTTIGKILLQKADDLPAIDQCLQLRWCAQVFEKATTFGRILQASHSFKKCIFIAGFLIGGVMTIWFHVWGFRSMY